MTISPFWTDTDLYYQIRRRLPKDPEPPAKPAPAGVLMTALLAYARAHGGLVNTADAAAALGRSEGAIRGSLQRLGAVKVKCEARVYRVEVER